MCEVPSVLLSSISRHLCLSQFGNTNASLSVTQLSVRQVTRLKLSAFGAKLEHFEFYQNTALRLLTFSSTCLSGLSSSLNNLVYGYIQRYLTR